MKLSCIGCGAVWYNGTEVDKGKPHSICKQKGVWGDFQPPTQKIQKTSKAAVGVNKFETSKVATNTFVVNWHTLLWNRRGLYGWAVAAVSGYRDVFVELIPNYTNRLYTVLDARLKHEIQHGDTFVLDPVGVIELLLHQLSRHPEGNIPKELVNHLLEAQRLLVQVKEGFTPPLEWTTHEEEVENINVVQPFFLEEVDA